MKLSIYTVIVNNFPAKGKHIAFNTKTQAQVVIDDDLKEKLIDLSQTHLDHAITKQLRTMGFIAESDVDEDRMIDEWFSRRTHNTSLLQATVLTTYDCNFACTYCIEKGVKSPVYMDEKMAHSTVSYIQKRIREDTPRKLTVMFYGGEPLMNPNAIRRISGDLQRFCTQCGISYSAGITTNGSHLTPAVVSELASLGISTVKVTLDGMRSHHDAKRPFRGGKGSFDTIIQGILVAVKELTVDVGGNFDEENYESFAPLLDYLSDHDLTEKIRMVRFKPISKIIQDRRTVNSDADLGCVYFDDQTMHRMVALRRTILEKRFHTDRGIGTNLCGAVMNGSHFTIDPLGKLFQCEALVGRDEFAVGSITAHENPGFITVELWKRCKDCAYVPLCGNGCLYAAYVRFGDFTKLNCNKPYMEYMVREYIKLNYQFRKHGSWS